MTNLITIQETFTLNISLEPLKYWLSDYYMSQHPAEEPSVWNTFGSGEFQLSYHAPPDGRITFIGKVTAPEKLTITSVRCWLKWELYCRDLIRAMQLRWSLSHSVPDFLTLVSDEKLARVLELRWEESKRTFQSEAYLSTIVLLGSILEGVLLAKIRQNPQQANQAKSTPKEKGNPRPFDKWKLSDLINVAHECGWLGRDVHDFSHTLRDYRNLVHPGEQAKQHIFPDQGTCRVAQEVVEAAVEDLIKHS